MKIKISRNNTLVMEKTMQAKATDPKHYRPPKPRRQTSHHSDMNNLKDGKDDQLELNLYALLKSYITNLT